MASDEDDRRWDDAQRERRMRYEAECETTRRLNEALLKGDHDTARHVTGMAPADPSGSRAAPEPEQVPTIGEQFYKSQQVLLGRVERAYVLPDGLQQRWTVLIEMLDIHWPSDSLPVIEKVREEYLDISRYPPPNTDVSGRITWDEQVPRIGDEIDWMIRLIRHQMTFE